MADVHVATAAAGNAPSGTASSVTAAATSPAQGAARKSIAVLPFANLTGDPGKEYFSDGMAEEVIHVLARIEARRG